MRKDKVKQRVISIGEKFVNGSHTVRSLGQETGWSKTTIHLDLKRLELINPELHKQAMNKLQENKSTRHINGGEATRKRWEIIKNGK